MILRSTSLLLREQIKTVDISFNIKLDSPCFPFCFAWGGVKHRKCAAKQTGKYIYEKMKIQFTGFKGELLVLADEPKKKKNQDQDIACLKINSNI